MTEPTSGGPSLFTKGVWPNSQVPEMAGLSVLSSTTLLQVLRPRQASPLPAGSLSLTGERRLCTVSPRVPAGASLSRLLLGPAWDGDGEDVSSLLLLLSCEENKRASQHPWARLG